MAVVLVVHGGFRLVEELGPLRIIDSIRQRDRERERKQGPALLVLVKRVPRVASIAIYNTLGSNELPDLPSLSLSLRNRNGYPMKVSKKKEGKENEFFGKWNGFLEIPFRSVSLLSYSFAQDPHTQLTGWKEMTIHFNFQLRKKKLLISSGSDERERERRQQGE